MLQIRDDFENEVMVVLLLLGSGKNQIDLRYLLGSLEIKSKVILSLGL